MLNKILRWSPVVFGLVIFAASVMGQTSTASILGLVTDASGAVIPGVSIAITNVETGNSRSVSSDASGNYRALLLPVGHYEVRAEKSGFQAEVRQGVDLVVGQEAVLNLQLSVGEVSQAVTVTAAAPLVNTTTASLSGLVDEQQVKDLPLNGRSYDNLITLSAGAVNYTAMKSSVSGGTGSGNYFAVDGRHPDENLFLMNGVEYTGMSQLGITPGGASGQLLGIDGVREFNVLSGTYGAEYGGRAGSQVSVVTQSGTNKLHGTLFEFLRNSAMDARNNFDQATIAPFKRNEFGGALGGPIQKDKTFIFGNYEGLRQRLGLSDVTFVPDNNARMGILPCGVIAPLPSGCSGTTDTTPMTVPSLNSGMLKFMAYWPVANGPNLGSGIAEAFSNPLQSIREDFGTVRVDHTFSNKDTLAGIYTVDDGFNFTPSTDPVFAIAFNLREQVASLQETHIFTPQVINTFTAGFSRGAFLFGGPAIPSFPSNLALVQGAYPGILSVGGSTSGGNTAPSTITQGGSNGAFNFRRNLFTYEDGLQVVKGKHQISAGLWFLRIQSNEDGATRGNGTASFTTLTTFLQGTASSFIGTPTSVPLYWRSLEGAWYVQDTIQLRPNLTLRLGLRHEFTNGWNEAHGDAANYTFSNAIIVTNPVVGNSIFTQNNAKLLFGPRVGLAWDPFGKGKTSIRAGFGIHYDLMDNLGFEFEAVPPFTPAVQYSNAAILPLIPLTKAEILPSCNTGVSTGCAIYAPQGVQQNAKTPTVEAWNLTVEQQLSQNMALSVSYVGSFGFHQLIAIDPNTVMPVICSNSSGCTSGGVGKTTGTVAQGVQYLPVGNRPNQFVGSGGLWLSAGNASYNALQAEFTRRISAGLQFKANFTWAQNLDTNSALSSGQAGNQIASVMNPYNLHQDWGPASQNVEHQGSGNFSYELPFGRGKSWLNGVSGVADKLVSGWQANGILTFLSGFPFTPLVGSNRSGDGDTKNPDRPNIVSGVSPTSGTTGGGCAGVTANRPLQTPGLWFNPCAFALPTAGTYGNVSRGALRGPGLADFDFSLFKNTKITERINTQFRAEFFNIVNHTNFGFPNPSVFSGTSVSPTAGIISTTTTTSRQIQLGLKLIF